LLVKMEFVWILCSPFSYWCIGVAAEVFMNSFNSSGIGFTVALNNTPGYRVKL